MGRLSRACKAAARWVGSWLIAGAVARRAAADARRQAKYAEACLTLVRRRTRERDSESQLRQRLETEKAQVAAERDELKGRLSVAKTQIEDLVNWRQKQTAQMESETAIYAARKVAATEQLKLDERE